PRVGSLCPPHPLSVFLAPQISLTPVLGGVALPGAPQLGSGGRVGGVQHSPRAEPGASSALSSSSSLQDAVLNACYRGCRLFSICHFVDASAELNTTRAECEAACAEAYGNAEEQFGCVTGCRKQLPEVEESRKELQAPSFSMLDLVSTFCNDIVSSAQSFISSTWTFYLQADDGKVVVFQVGVSSGSSLCVPRGYPAPEALEIQPGDKPPVKERSKTKANPPEPPQQEHDFLGCMSKRSGLPRWILAACLFLSIMVMLWLSCASLVTAPEQHVKTQVRAGDTWGGQGLLARWDGAVPSLSPPILCCSVSLPPVPHIWVWGTGLGGGVGGVSCLFWGRFSLSLLGRV
uniref:Transmembrane protein 59 like n=1 Tax=Catharus ustulatus TaxID=91951 RepID=A0A8C3UA88_CATUS